MKIKKYISKNLNEGKRKIKSDLGDNAVILSSRKAKKASTGEEYFEIVAAVDNNVKTAPPRSGSENKTTDNYTNKKNKSSTDTPAANSELFKEIRSLRSSLDELSETVKYKHSTALGPVFGKLYKIMRKSEISEELSLKIIGNITAMGFVNDLPTALEQARYLLKERISVSNPLKKSDGHQRVMLLGSTGSGKTTALIKIAIICKLVMKADVMIISADTYKVGGAEQLETYASISNLPYKSVYNADELEEIIDHERDRDFIFLDTPGRNHLNRDFIKELEVFSDKFKPHRKLNVMSATSSEEFLRQQQRSFNSLKPDGVVLTKLDECYSIGNIISILENMPVNYLSTGQNVPDDLEPADKELMIKYLLPEKIVNNFE